MTAGNVTLSPREASCHLFPKTNPLIWHRVRPNLTLMIAALIDPFRRSIVEIILSFRQASARTPTTLTITKK